MWEKTSMIPLLMQEKRWSGMVCQVAEHTHPSSTTSALACLAGKSHARRAVRARPRAGVRGFHGFAFSRRKANCWTSFSIAAGSDAMNNGISAKPKSNPSGLQSTEKKELLPDLVVALALMLVRPLAFFRGVLLLGFFLWIVGRRVSAEDDIVWVDGALLEFRDVSTAPVFSTGLFNLGFHVSCVITVLSC